MAAATQNVLVAGVAHLTSTFTVFIGMREQHIFRMGQVMAGAVIAKGLAMAIEAFLFSAIRDAAVFDRPAKVGVRWRHGTHDDWRFDEGLIPAPNDRDGVA